MDNQQEVDFGMQAESIVGTTNQTYLDSVVNARLVIEEAVKAALSDAQRRERPSMRDQAIIDRIVGIVRGFCVVLTHHGAPNEVLKDFVEGAAVYLNVDSEKQFVSRGKYMCTAPMAEFLRNELPALKDERWRPKRSFRRWYRSRIAKVTRVNCHLWFSWLQAKRSALPLTENMILLNYMEHHDAMLKPDPMEPTLIDFSMDLLAPVLEYTKRQIAKSDLTPPLAQASRSAAFEASRARGGQMGELARYLGIDTEVDGGEIEVETAVESGDVTLKYDRYTGVSIEPVTEMKTFRTNVSTINELDTNKFSGMREVGLRAGKDADIWGVQDVLMDPVAYAAWTKTTNTDSFATAATEIGLEAKPESDRQLYRDALHQSMTDCLECTIQAVREPFKIRTISKGNALSYYVSGGYQKALHSALRKLKCFRLIGRPVCPTDLEDLVYDSDEKLYWISGDYKASTDNLSSGLSQRINRYLAADLPFELVYRACLESHLCHYPKVEVDSALCEEFMVWCDKHSYDWREYVSNKDGKIWVQVPDVQQVNAQLMGSRVSFPILCLANLALYLIVKCVSSGNFTPTRTQIIQWVNRVLINGDDILFAGPLREFELLRVWGQRVGLELSVGKAYVHDEYANVNSTSFMYKILSGSTPRQVNYLNSGLFFGLNKVQNKSKDDPKGEGEVERTHRCATIDRLLDGCLPGRQKEILGNYLSLHKQQIVVECGGRNLFIHRSLGGLGVRCPVGWRYEVTQQQYLVAARLLEKFKNRVVPDIRPYQTRVLPDFESEKIISPWRAIEPSDSEELLPRRGRKKAPKCPITQEERDALEIGVVHVVGRGEKWRLGEEEALWKLSDDFNMYAHQAELEFRQLELMSLSF